MNILKTFLFCMMIALTSPCFAEDDVSAKPAQEGDNSLAGFLIFQIIKNQIVLDNSNIKSASLVEEGSRGFIGLKIVLKSFAVPEMERISTAGIGQPANLIFNKKVVSTSLVQSSLGNTLLITGLTKEEAQRFLKTLTINEKIIAKRTKFAANSA